jgi:transcriptional regulator with GAF, ATPase, and Fis domain
MFQAWYRSTRSAGAAAAAAACQALAAQGVSLEPAAPQGRAGLLLLGAVDTEAHDALRDLSRGGDVRVIALYTGEPPLRNAQFWALMESGAADVVAAPLPQPAAAGLAARLQRWEEVDALLASPVVQQNLCGASLAWRRVLRQVVEVACFTAGNVLITGESGTGKELTARLIHTLDRRAGKGQLVVLDCTTVMPELAGSEFFGHERGAFTGATGPRDGAFALANGGTLFLDEVGELPASMQPQLLRVIQERSYKRLGGSQWSSTQFRLVCATHRNLQAGVADGAFRGDLYHRIAGCRVRLPPLRERHDDILLLARGFLAEAWPGREPPPFQEPVRDYLLGRGYPGNVRELRQLMFRIAGRHLGDGPITVGDLPDDERPAGTEAPEPDWRGPGFDDVIRRALCLGVGLKDISTYAAEAAIRIAVGEEGGNLQRAARRLGVTDRALQLRRASGLGVG